jgi:hypothetical protein
MQSYIHAKNNPKSEKQKTKTLRTAEQEVKPSAQELSGKFRLSTWSRKPRRKVKAPIKKKQDVSNSSTLSVNHHTGQSDLDLDNVMSARYSLH